MSSTFFSEQELHYIVENSTLSSEEIAFHLGKDKADVVSAKKTLGIPEFPDAREWTDEETDFLKDNYGKLTYKEIAFALHRTKESVSRRANRIGIVHKRERHAINGTLWSSEELRYLIGHKDDNCEDTAKHLGRSVSSVRNKLTQLKFRKKTRKGWTDREISYLYKHGFTEPYADIAKKLHRSICSVRCKATSLGITKYSSSVTLSDIERAFDVDSSYVNRYWIKKNNMPAKRIVLGQHCYFDVDLNEFWRWASEHMNVVPMRKYKKGSLLPEPDNLEALIRMAPKHSENHRKPYTTAEKEKIKNEYLSGKSVQMIAEQHGRSVCSIKHVLY